MLCVCVVRDGLSFSHDIRMERQKYLISLAYFKKGKKVVVFFFFCRIFFIFTAFSIKRNTSYYGLFLFLKKKGGYERKEIF